LLTSHCVWLIHMARTHQQAWEMCQSAPLKKSGGADQPVITPKTTGTDRTKDSSQADDHVEQKEEEHPRRDEEGRENVDQFDHDEFVECKGCDGQADRGGGGGSAKVPSDDLSVDSNSTMPIVGETEASWTPLPSPLPNRHDSDSCTPPSSSTPPLSPALAQSPFSTPVSSWPPSPAPSRLAPDASPASTAGRNTPSVSWHHVRYTFEKLCPYSAPRSLCCADIHADV